MAKPKAAIRMCPMLTNCWTMDEAKAVLKVLRENSKTNKELRPLMRKLRKSIKINSF